MNYNKKYYINKKNTAIIDTILSRRTYLGNMNNEFKFHYSIFSVCFTCTECARQVYTDSDPWKRIGHTQCPTFTSLPKMPKAVILGLGIERAVACDYVRLWLVLLSDTCSAELSVALVIHPLVLVSGGAGFLLSAPWLLCNGAAAMSASGPRDYRRKSSCYLYSPWEDGTSLCSVSLDKPAPKPSIPSNLEVPRWAHTFSNFVPLSV